MAQTARPARPRLVLGTRRSELALWQTNHVAQLLQAAWPGLVCTLAPMDTRGDRVLHQPLPEIGGKGLFTAELEDALRAGAIDLAVHSLKDLPVDETPGLTIGAIPARGDVQDGLVTAHGWTLASLPQGAVVGTSSTRRRAQLLAARPDLDVRSIRGNVQTRVGKVLTGDYQATVLAQAGLQRLNLLDVVSEWLALDVMLPAPGQGALAVQCRADDHTTLDMLAAIEDSATRAAVTAERMFLQELGGGCAAPIAAYTAATGERGLLAMRGLVGTGDGRRILRVAGSGAQPEELARSLAEQALALGARELLAHA